MVQDPRFKSQAGFAALFVTMLVLTIMLGIGISLFILVIGEYRISRNIIQSSQVYYAAEAGIEDAVYRIRNLMNIPSSYSVSVDSASVQVSVEEPNQNTRIVTAFGAIGDISRKLENILNIATTNPNFFYGAQAGNLGVVMGNNARIEGAGGVAGNVYSNGSIDGDAGANITGDVFVATGMSEDQTHTVNNSNQIFGENNPIIDIAQSFTPSLTNNLVKVSVYIKKVGNPDDATVRILTDSAGSPSKTVLASVTLRRSLVGTAYGWVDVVFSSPPNLTQGTTYWFAIDASKDNDDYWVWAKDQNQGYGNGQAKYTQNWNDQSPVWTTIIGDLDFKTYMGGQATFLRDVTVIGDAHANTIQNSQICGNGYYQTIDSGSLSFLNNPSQPTCPQPLTPGAAFPGSVDPPLQNMPVSESNINQWKNEAALGGTLTGNLAVNSNLSYGPKKIDGNIIMTSNNKTLTVDGTIWATGYLDISNGSAIRCSPSYGLNSCLVIVDKWVHIDNNGSFQGSGTSGSYIMVLSASACDGTASPNCTDHNAAMDLHNNAVGAIFYANDGLIHLHNGVEVAELVAKKIHLENNAIIRYEQGLALASFSSGPGASWQVVSWEEIE